MAYSTALAGRLRHALEAFPQHRFVEKKMFGGLAFLLNDKMCINVSGDRLMCRFDPREQPSVSKRKGFEEMVMRGKKMAGFCYVTKEGFTHQEDFDFWIHLCLEYNRIAPKSK